MVQGRGVDAPINETGRTQAKKAYDRLKEVNFDTVYTSTLLRTHQTAKSFIESGIPHKVHSGLDEISWGSHEGVMPDLVAKNDFNATIEAWKDGKVDLNIGGGESPLDVMKRQKVAMKEILAGDASTILICMHGRAMRILLSWLINQPLKDMDNFPHTNCGYYKLTYQGTFAIDEFNVTDHLE